jgi:hypothetical protein
VIPIDESSFHVERDRSTQRDAHGYRMDLVTIYLPGRNGVASHDLELCLGLDANATAAKETLLRWLRELGVV